MFSSLVVLLNLLVGNLEEPSLDIQAAPAVHGGTRVGADDDIARFTVGVLVHSEGGWGRCTGSLIDHYVVLTAAHCVAGDVSEVSVVFSREMFEPGAPTVAVSDWVVPDGYADDNRHFAIDIALLKLAAPAPDGYVPVRLGTGDLPVDRLQAVRVAGFGVVSRYGQQGVGNDEGYLQTAGIVSVSQAEGGLLTLRETEGTGTCGGDSGGPVFARDRHGPVVVATTVAGQAIDGNPDNCQGVGIYLKLADWVPWINQSMKALVGRRALTASCGAGCGEISADVANLADPIAARNFTAKVDILDGRLVVRISNSTSALIKCEASIFSTDAGGRSVRSRLIIGSMADGTWNAGEVWDYGARYLVNCS